MSLLRTVADTPNPDPKQVREARARLKPLRDDLRDLRRELEYAKRKYGPDYGAAQERLSHALEHLQAAELAVEAARAACADANSVLECTRIGPQLGQLEQVLAGLEAGAEKGAISEWHRDWATKEIQRLRDGFGLDREAR